MGEPASWHRPTAVHYALGTRHELGRVWDRNLCGRSTVRGRRRTGVWCAECWAEVRRRFWPLLEG